MTSRSRAGILYRLLLRLQPRPFRQKYGAEMERAFVQLLGRERTFRGAAAVWLGGITDLLRSAVVERRASPCRKGHLMDTLRTDLRQALRGFAAMPGFTLAAVLTIALGIGANSAIFSLVSAAMLRPLPYANPEGVVMLWQTFDRFDIDEVPWTLHDYLDVRERSTQLSHAALFRSGSRVLAGTEPRRLQAATVSPVLFDLLGVPALHGRAFIAEDEQPASADRIVLSHATWQQVFGGRLDVIGSTVTLDGRPHDVLGVMPPTFRFPPPVTYGDVMLKMQPDIFLPFVVRPEPREGNHSHFAIGRLAPGATLDSANAELAAIAAALGGEHPTLNDGVGARAVSLQGQSVATFRTALIILLGAVACVLLVACTSVANLLMARAMGRKRELALRAAVGASRRRLVTQLLIESGTLGVAGGIAGLLIAAWVVRIVGQLNPLDLPDIYAAALDWRVLAFTLGVTFAAVLLFGLAPALQASRPDLLATLRSGARIAGSRGERRVKNVLAVTQVAVAVLLLVLASLTVRSLNALWTVDAGFDVESLLTFNVTLPDDRYPSAESHGIFTDRLMRELEGLPAVQSVAASSMLPFVFDKNSTNYFVEGEPPPAEGQAQFVDRTLVTEHYFDAIGAELLWGRAMTPADARAGRVGVVNEAFARRHWPNGDWEGRRMAFEEVPADDAGWVRIIGVIRDIRSAGLGLDAEPTIYLPLMRAPRSGFFVLVRGAMDAGALIAPTRAALSRIDPGLPMDDVELMATRKADSVRKPRFTAWLLGAFGVVALIIAATGLYGVMSYDAGQRTREIGIRIALGARPSSVRSLITRRGLGLTITGLLAGLAASIPASRAAESLLFGVRATDLLAFGFAGLTLLATGWLATWLPARRATRVDPMIALRSE